MQENVFYQKPNLYLIGREFKNRPRGMTEGTGKFISKGRELFSLHYILPTHYRQHYHLTGVKKTGCKRNSIGNTAGYN